MELTEESFSSNRLSHNDYFFWGIFFKWGQLDFPSPEWQKEISYIHSWKKAILSGIIPVRRLFETHQTVELFLGNPEVPIVPQLLLLYFLPEGTYVWINHTLMALLGCFGIFKLASHFGFSSISTFFLFVVLSFNGYICSHIGVGHSMWSGYLVLPFFCYFFLLIREPLERKKETRAIALLALCMTLVLTVGAIHIFVWLNFFLLLSGLFGVVPIRRLCYVFMLVFFLCSFRILPAYIAFRKYHNDFISGFPNLEILLQSFLSPHPPEYPEINGLSWWEYSQYVGFPAVLILFIFGVIPSIRKFNQMKALCLIYGTFCLGDNYAFFIDSHVPLLNSERVSTRGFIVVFLFFCIFTTQKINTFSKKNSHSIYSLCILTLTIGSLYLMFNYSMLWSQGIGVIGSPKISIDPEIAMYFISGDLTVYEIALLVGYSTSVLAFGYALSLIFSNENTRLFSTFKLSPTPNV